MSPSYLEAQPHPLDVVEPPKIRDDWFHGGRCKVHNHIV